MIIVLVLIESIEFTLAVLINVACPDLVYVVSVEHSLPHLLVCSCFVGVHTKTTHSCLIEHVLFLLLAHVWKNLVNARVVL